MSSNQVARTATDALTAKLSAVSVGYNPVRGNGHIYNELLYKIASGLASRDKNAEHDRCSAPIRRQTPLVNAGYAARIAAVSRTLERYLLAISSRDKERAVKEKSENSSTGIINVVLLGCGMDALGLWSSSLSLSSSVHVYEVDCDENCRKKYDALVHSGLLHPMPCERQDSSSFWLDGDFMQAASENGTNNSGDKWKSDGFFFGRGQINLMSLCGGSQFCCGDNEMLIQGNSTPHKAPHLHKQVLMSNQPHSTSNYTILGSNLRDVSSIRRALMASKIDNSNPTIIISELVLAYLGKKGTDSLLDLIASELCTAESSGFLAYEPIGGTPMEGDAVLPVVDSYCYQYHRQFTAKLNKGHHQEAKSVELDRNVSDERADVFHPIGSDCGAIQARLESHGFGTTRCCLAGVAAASAVLQSPRENKQYMMEAPELFDEHAALALHLRCYSLACAFSRCTENRFVQKVCPWTNLKTLVTRYDWTNIHSCGSKIAVSPISATDQEHVRDLFRGSYSSLFNQYPAVKNMVKRALKTDLSVKDDAALGIANNHGDGPSESSIWRWYNCHGGIFLVAKVQREISPYKEDRTVVGCVGVRLCAVSEGRSWGSGANLFEVHRLVVDGQYRGRGIGKALLMAVESFVAKKVGISCDYTLIATTPAMLDAANQLYSSCGFELCEERLLGKIVMRTYVKKVPPLADT